MIFHVYPGFELATHLKNLKRFSAISWKMQSKISAYKNNFLLINHSVISVFAVIYKFIQRNHRYYTSSWSTIFVEPNKTPIASFRSLPIDFLSHSVQPKRYSWRSGSMSRLFVLLTRGNSQLFLPNKIVLSFLVKHRKQKFMSSL